MGSSPNKSGVGLAKVGVVVFMFVLSCRNGTIEVLWVIVFLFSFLLSCRNGTKAGLVASLRRKGPCTVRFRRSCCRCRCRRRSVIKDFKKLLPLIEALFVINETLTVSLEWGLGGKAWVL